MQKIQEKTTISIGVQPYPRIIPALFLKNFAIYCVNDTADLDVLRKVTTIYCLEERNSKMAAKTHSTAYVLKSFPFDAFLKSRKRPFRLFFNQLTPPIIETLKEKDIEGVGNDPRSFADVMVKGDFRDLLKKYKLPCLPDWRVSREAFLALSFKEAWAKWERPFVIQRADCEVGSEPGTFFIWEEEDWEAMRVLMVPDERYKEVTMSPYVTGNSVSVLGCVTSQGVFTSMLQLQLIDVPEALYGKAATGVFLGHDWSYKDWPDSVEKTAQMVTEKIGQHLGSNGYKGIFGIDFMHDRSTNEIYALECNPRFTGACPLYSLMSIHLGVPPMELFHIADHLGIPIKCSFEKLNEAYKKRMPFSHISLTPLGMKTMPLDLQTGVYRYSPDTREMDFIRQGAFPWDLREGECLLIDSVPRKGGRVTEGAVRLCKLIFPRGIAKSSYEVFPDIADQIVGISAAFRQDQEQEDVRTVPVPQKEESDFNEDARVRRY